MEWCESCEHIRKKTEIFCCFARKFWHKVIINIIMCPVNKDTKDKLVNKHFQFRVLETNYCSRMGLSLSRLQEIVKDREASRAAVHGETKSWTQLRDGTTITTDQETLKPYC